LQKGAKKGKKEEEGGEKVKGKKSKEKFQKGRDKSPNRLLTFRLPCQSKSSCPVLSPSPLEREGAAGPWSLPVIV
jgi:hypothetical protein